MKPPSEPPVPNPAIPEEPAPLETADSLGEGRVLLLSVSAGVRRLESLTDAEQAVAELVVEGRSNREIAEQRGASVKTVANQLRAIYQKLGIASRYELAALLVR